MANVSKFKVPNGTTYTIKDSTARSGASAANTLATSAMNNIATIESSSTASKAYSVGDYLVHNNILYKVITGINSGETLTPNANIEATTTGAELTALNNGSIGKYSTAEKVVGEWIDGKPIYRKTYSVTSGFSSGMTIANLTSMNVETIVYISGMLSRSEGITITIPNGNPQAAYNAYAADVNGVLQVGYGSSIKPKKILLSIMYTKTTD